MQNKINPEVNFRTHKDKILEHAEKFGDIYKIETWRKAFEGDIEFPETIDNTDILWEEEFSPVEIAAYVAIMTATKSARLSYSLETIAEASDWDDDEEEYVDGELNGADNELTLLMNCWIAHLFEYFEDGSFDAPDGAIELLLQYATEERIKGNVYRSSTAEGPAYLDSLSLTHAKVVK